MGCSRTFLLPATFRRIFEETRRCWDEEPKKRPKNPRKRDRRTNARNGFHPNQAAKCKQRRNNKPKPKTSNNPPRRSREGSRRVRKPCCVEEKRWLWNTEEKQLDKERNPENTHEPGRRGLKPTQGSIEPTRESIGQEPQTSNCRQPQHSTRRLPSEDLITLKKTCARKETSQPA